MSVFHGTPESLLPRSDSKNPASTCRGLTSTGRPCRRAISQSPQSSPCPSPRREVSTEAFCWQHRDQTPTAAPQKPHNPTIRERTSVDTLVDRLGILEVEEQKKRRKPVPDQRERPNQHPPRKETVQHPDKHAERGYKRRPERPRPQPNPKSNLDLFCCIGIADDSKAPSPKPRPVRPAQNPVPRISSIPPQVQPKIHSTNLLPNSTLQRPQIARDPSSRTGEFLSLIPPSATPQTTALLLAELAKPISENDDEGFIYIFWLTPESLPSAPPSETASSLLAPPTRPKPGRRRTSDVLSTFSSTTTSSNSKKTIFLKIGRAQNVHRRLNQWTKQCEHNLSLIRYYPYTPSASSNELPRTPRKIPCVHRVERLIHIELDAKRARGSGKCDVCEREHREWFEVEAAREGVKAVDEVVRRWADWSERERCR